MLKMVTEFLVAIATGVLCWLSLSFLFFPIKLSTSADEYFMATITHMVPLKTFITIVFALLAVFLYEQFANKMEKESQQEHDE